MIWKLTALRRDALWHRRELLLDSRDASCGFAVGRIGFEHLRFRFSGLDQRQVFLLRQHDQVVALLKVSQLLLRPFQLSVVLIGFVVEEIGGAFRVIQLQVFLQIEVAKFLQDRRGQLRRIR